MTFSAIHILLALGAAAVFLCLPAPGPAGRRWRIAGLILGLGTLAALGIYMLRWTGPEFEGRSFFVIFACLALLGSVRVISHPKPVYSALYFVLVVLSVAALAVLAAAEFLGAALVIVYAGAILVTYVFVIMLAQQSGVAPYDQRAREPLAAVALGFVLAFASAQAMQAARTPPMEAAGERPAFRLIAMEALPGSGQAGRAGQVTATELNSLRRNEEVGNVLALGGTLMTTFAVAVEVAGVLLLVAMVGAIAIAQKRIEPQALTPAERREIDTRETDLNRIGRSAPPF